MIGIEIKKSGFGGQTPSGIVITGGGAKTVGITDSAKRTLAMPVRIAIPTNVKGIIDEVGEPSFATVIGLVTYGGTIEVSSSLPFGFSIPKIPFKLNNKMFAKAVAFLKSFLP
jgi:cell division protein FtsA